jgi:GTPase SAR1 family protein
VLDESLYTQEDVMADRQACLGALNRVIENRQQLLLEEVESINSGFYKIKDGEMLSEKEGQALEIAVNRIRDLKDLGKRIPSFVYEEFIEKYVIYFRNNYPAWNTKHAINRRFGTYDIRNIDIFYDAKVVAEGESDEEMLKKFTKEAKTELECVLNELTEANEALEAFIPDLVKELDAAYDDFVAQVGTDIEQFLHEKLSPQSSESPFWYALISEKGTPRPRGETYTDNVCQTYRRELESVQSLNEFLEARTKVHWAELVSKVLDHFGE